jgi:membrane protein implicated in regulation of membrane protease activity
MAVWMPWGWLVMAVLFAVAEIFTAGFFLICFGIGAGAAALTAFMGLGLVWQTLAFVAVSALAVLLSRPLANRLAHPNTHAIGGDRLLGQEGIVLETIDPVSGRGVVRVGHERWSAVAVEGRPIAAGSTIVVVAINGTHLQVRPVPLSIGSSQ